MDYIDKVLIKLKRDYSRDELVSALYKKITELEIEKGKLSAEISHLEHEAKYNVSSKIIIRYAKVELSKEKIYINQLNENKKLINVNIQLKNSVNELLSKLLLSKI